MAMNTPNNGFNFPLPPPTPIPPPPSADHPTIIVVVVISFGCLFVFGAMLLCLWCLFKRHCKKKKLVHEREDIDVDEHLKVQEMVLPGPHGPRTVVLSVEDNVRVHKDVHKDEIDMVGKGLHAEPSEAGTVNSLEAEAGSSQQLSHPEHQV